jgi:hypothetical protein
MQWEHCLGVRTPPADYFWVKVRLDDYEVSLVSTVLDMVIAQHRGGTPIRYSTVHTPNGFDTVGRIKSGVGMTCATFIMNVFDQLKFRLVEDASWKSRPNQDRKFRDRIADIALQAGPRELAERIRSETAAFRVKPYELYGSASHSRYPVKFIQAAKLAKTLTKLVRRLTHRPQTRT